MPAASGLLVSILIAGGRKEEEKEDGECRGEGGEGSLYTLS
jgi:hypothetical protein